MQAVVKVQDAYQKGEFNMSTYSYEKNPLSLPEQMKVTITKGSNVYGTCGADGVSLTEVAIQPANDSTDSFTLHTVDETTPTEPNTLTVSDQ